MTLTHTAFDPYIEEVTSKADTELTAENEQNFQYSRYLEIVAMSLVEYARQDDQYASWLYAALSPYMQGYNTNTDSYSMWERSPCVFNTANRNCAVLRTEWLIQCLKNDGNLSRSNVITIFARALPTIAPKLSPKSKLVFGLNGNVILGPLIGNIWPFINDCVIQEIVLREDLLDSPSTSAKRDIVRHTARSNGQIVHREFSYMRNGVDMNPELERWLYDGSPVVIRKSDSSESIEKVSKTLENAGVNYACSKEQTDAVVLVLPPTIEGTFEDILEPFPFVS